jgi:hypothetical protein
MYWMSMGSYWFAAILVLIVFALFGIDVDKAWRALTLGCIIIVLAKLEVLQTEIEIERAKRDK